MSHRSKIFILVSRKCKLNKETFEKRKKRLKNVLYFIMLFTNEEDSRIQNQLAKEVWSGHLDRFEHVTSFIQISRTKKTFGIYTQSRQKLCSSLRRWWRFVTLSQNIMEGMMKFISWVIKSKRFKTHQRKFSTKWRRLTLWFCLWQLHLLNPSKQKRIAWKHCQLESLMNFASSANLLLTVQVVQNGWWWILEAAAEELRKLPEWIQSNVAMAQSWMMLEIVFKPFISRTQLEGY